MFQAQRKRRLGFTNGFFDRFTRSTHFHPDFLTNNRLINWRLVGIIAAVVVAVYIVLISATDVAIYRKGIDNKFTQAVEQIFPYPAAVVGNQVIPLSRFRREVNARVVYASKHQIVASKSDIQKLVINQLVDKTLYATEIQKYNITISDKDIDASLQDIYTKIGGQDKLDQFLKDNYGDAITEADFRQWVQESLVESSIEHQILTRATVDHILISVPDNATDDQVAAARQKALDVKAMITDPSKFGAIAKQYSEDVSSRDNGGSLGTTVRGSDGPIISQDFQNAIFSLPLNQVSDPVRSKYGWHLIMVTARAGSVDESLTTFTQQLHTQTKIKAFIGI